MNHFNTSKTNKNITAIVTTFTLFTVALVYTTIGLIQLLLVTKIKLFISYS